jgi:hypothetical protein
MKRILSTIFFSLVITVLPTFVFADENHLPEFSGPTNASTVVETNLEFVVTANDVDGNPDALGNEVSLSQELPEGASYDAGAGLFSWTPASAGNFTAKFFATDGIGTSTHEVIIDVSEPCDNRLPEIIGPDTATTTVGSLLEFVVTVNDPDGNPDTFGNVVTQSQELPEGASYDAGTGIFSWIPTSVGTSTATFFATDGIGTSTHETLINVSELFVNHVPDITGPDSATTTVGTILEFVVTVNDVDGNPDSSGNVVTVSTDLPTGATYATSTGIFSWTPTSIGTSTATFFATDGIGTSTHPVLIEVFSSDVATNSPPHFVNFNPPTVATSTQAYSYDVDAEDPDNDPLSFSLTQKPSGMTIATSTGVISWEPNITQATTTPYDVTVGVSDGMHEVTESYQIVVSAPRNRLPDISGPTSVSVNVNSLLEFVVTVNDLDGNPDAYGNIVRLSQELPGGSIYSATSGIFSWTPASAGNFTATFFATDGVGTSTLAVAIEVKSQSTGGGGGGGGGGTIIIANGPPGLLQPPVYPTPIQPAQPTTVNTPVNNSAPLQPIPKIEKKAEPKVTYTFEKPAEDTLVITATSTATSTPTAERRGFAALLLAGLFNLFDWIGSNWCILGWLLWLLTLIAFLLYVLFHKREEYVSKIYESSGPMPSGGTQEAFDLPEGIAFKGHTPDIAVNEYWETYRQEKE